MQVAAKKTLFDGPHLRDTLIDSHPHVFDGRPPSENRLSCAWAQLMLESGRGQGCWNWNPGNIKAGPNPGPEKTWTKIPVPAGSSEPANQYAYADLTSGCDAYWSLLKLRYPRSLKQADTGDAANFGVALGEEHYYTAPIGPYADTVRKLADEYRRTWPFGASNLWRWLIAAGTSAGAAYAAWRERHKRGAR